MLSYWTYSPRNPHCKCAQFIQKTWLLIMDWDKPVFRVSFLQKFRGFSKIVNIFHKLSITPSGVLISDQFISSFMVSLSEIICSSSITDVHQAHSQSRHFRAQSVLEDLWLKLHNAWLDILTDSLVMMQLMVIIGSTAGGMKRCDAVEVQHKVFSVTDWRWVALVSRHSY